MISENAELRAMVREAIQEATSINGMSTFFINKCYARLREMECSDKRPCFLQLGVRVRVKNTELGSGVKGTIEYVNIDGEVLVTLDGSSTPIWYLKKELEFENK